MINKFIFGVSIVGVTLFASVMLEIFEGEVNTKKKKEFIEYIESSEIRERIKSIDDPDYKLILSSKLEKIMYNLCVYYEYGKEKLYYEQIDAILHDIEVYQMGKKINLVF